MHLFNYVDSAGTFICVKNDNLSDNYVEMIIRKYTFSGQRILIKLRFILCHKLSINYQLEL